MKKFISDIGFWKGVCIVLLITQFGCYRWDVETVNTGNYQPELALPIGEFDISVEDLINKEDLNAVDPDTISDGMLLLRYKDTYYGAPSSYDTTITLNFNLRLKNDYQEYIKYLIVRSNFINYSHASTFCQVYFKTIDNEIFDSLFIDGPINIKAGSINSNGSIKKVELLRNDEFFDRERIDRLIEGAMVDVKTTFEFSQEDPVIWYTSDHLMWIQLGMRIGLDIETDQFK